MDGKQHECSVRGVLFSTRSVLARLAAWLLACVSHSFASCTPGPDLRACLQANKIMNEVMYAAKYCHLFVCNYHQNAAIVFQSVFESVKDYCIFK